MVALVAMGVTRLEVEPLAMMRRFFARLFRFQAAPAQTPPQSVIQVAYQDAYAILTAIYDGQPKSRAAWKHRIGQARWERAIDLLKQAGILDRKGGYIFDYTRDLDTARDDLLEVANAEQERRTHRNWVSAK